MPRGGAGRALALGVGLALLASLVDGVGTQDERPGAQRDLLPNLLFVFADAHRASAVGCYGNEVVRTPNIDRLAEQGTRFANAVANTPVCRPMRFTNLTGLHAFRGDYGAGESVRDHETIGDLLTEAGYECGYVGKWHLGRVDVAAGEPERVGFDAFWRVVGDRDGRENHSYESWSVWDGPGEPRRETGFRPDAVAEHAIEFLERERERPFCLYVSFGPPHAPLTPPEELDRPLRGPLPANVPDDEDQRLQYRRYVGLLEGVDRAFGRLLAALERTGAADDTLVVYTSDHGSMLGAHGMQAKGAPFSEALSIPLVVRWPGRVPAGRAVRALVGVVDFVPTWTGLLGVDAPRRTDGRDLSELVLGGAEPTGQGVYLAARGSAGAKDGWRGLRTARFTYARWEDGPWLLYDDERDPWQEDNLVLSGERDALVAELDELLLEHMEALGDDWEDLPVRRREELPYPDVERLERSLRELVHRRADERLDIDAVMRLYGLDLPRRRFRSSRYLTRQDPPPPHQLARSELGDESWSVLEVRNAVQAWLDLLARRGE